MPRVPSKDSPSRFAPSRVPAGSIFQIVLLYNICSNASNEASEYNVRTYNFKFSQYLLYILAMSNEGPHLQAVEEVG